jgi:hypothetical protein
MSYEDIKHELYRGKQNIGKTEPVAKGQPETAAKIIVSFTDNH